MLVGFAFLLLKIKVGTTATTVLLMETIMLN